MPSGFTVRQRNWALALLFLTGVLNIFDRQIINILAQDIKNDLSISDTQLGLLTGTAFGLFYSVLGIPLGRLADRVDRIKLIAGALTLWSLFTGLCGVAGSFVQLFFTRMGVGVGEAASQPASTALIPDLFSEERRTSAMSVLLMSAPAGAFLGLLAGGYIGALWGWRTAFVVAAMPGFILAVLMILTTRDPRSAVPAAQRAPVAPMGATIRLLLQNRRFVWLAVGLICVSFFPYGPAAWLPPMFMRVYEMTTAQVGMYSAIAVGLGGVGGTLGSGLVCDWLRTRIDEVELKVLAFILTLTVAALLVTTLSTSRDAALGGLFVFYLGAFSFLGPIVSLILKEATPQSRSLVAGMCVSISNIINLGVAMPLVGAISDVLAPAHGPHSIRFALAMVGTVAGLIGLFAYWRAAANAHHQPR